MTFINLYKNSLYDISYLILYMAEIVMLGIIDIYIYSVLGVHVHNRIIIQMIILYLVTSVGHNATRYIWYFEQISYLEEQSISIMRFKFLDIAFLL